MRNISLRWILWVSVIFLPLSATAVELKFNTQDFPPYSYQVDGEIAGPGVEIIQRVCRELGIKCSFDMLVWTRAQKEVEEGKAQALFFIGKNEEREKWLYFSPPVVQTYYGFFVHEHNPLQYKKPADVAGYSVGVYGPSNTSTSLEKIVAEISKTGLKPLSVDMRPNDEAGFQKLSMKRLQAVYSNHDVGVAMIAKIGLKNIRYAGTHERLDYYVGFSKKHVDKALIDRFNSALLRLQKSGEIRKILDRYQMKDVLSNHIPDRLEASV